MLNSTTIFHLWNTIVQSNTFNFILFVLILAWVFNKIDVSSMIASLQEKIVKIINDAKIQKETALENLSRAEKSIEELPKLITEIINSAEKSAAAIGDKLYSEAKKQIEDIEVNSEKLIAAEEKMLISKLAKSTSQASVDSAKLHIKSVLDQVPSLHEKYINESIDNLDRLNI